MQKILFFLFLSSHLWAAAPWSSSQNEHRDEEPTSQDDGDIFSDEEYDVDDSILVLKTEGSPTMENTQFGFSSVVSDYTITPISSNGSWVVELRLADVAIVISPTRGVRVAVEAAGVDPTNFRHITLPVIEEIHREHPECFPADYRPIVSAPPQMAL